MPRQLDYVYGDKPELSSVSSPTAARPVESVSTSISTAATSLTEIGGLGSTIASGLASSGVRPTAPYRAQLPERDYDDYTPSISPTNLSLLHERLQILTASQRLAITFRTPRGLSGHGGSGVSPSISARPSANPPATTSQAASLRLQELARSLQVQAARERERVPEQLRTSTTPVGWVETTTFSTGPPGSPLVMRERYSRVRNTGSTVEHAPEESGSSQDEDDEEEGNELDGDVITFADGTVPSEEMLRMWYDTRRLEEGLVDANGVKQTKRQWHRRALEGR